MASKLFSCAEILFFDIFEVSTKCQLQNVFLFGDISYDVRIAKA